MSIIASLIGLTACQKAGELPTLTPDQGSVMAASTLFAQPTRAIQVTPTSTPSPELELSLNQTIARMEQAVLAGNVDDYLSLVWSGDLLFLTEHSRWAQDWQDHPLSVFEIELFSIQQLDEDVAAARMATRWTRGDFSGNSSSGGATTSVLFRRAGDMWLLAGERWQTVEIEGFTFYYFKNEIVNNQLQADAVLESLPVVYTMITRLFDYIPHNDAHLKLYDSYATLRNWTRLSVPFVASWNKPGEAIRMAVNPVNNAAPSDFDLAREYTRSVLFEMGSRDNFPWWLEEGVAAYGGLQFRTLSYRNRLIEDIAKLASMPEDAEYRLFAWSEIDDRPNMPEDDLQIAVNQAFTLVQFVTEVYGDDARNVWIKAIATDQTLEEACESVFGMGFADLEASWRVWLLEQM